MCNVRYTTGALMVLGFACLAAGSPGREVAVRTGAVLGHAFRLQIETRRFESTEHRLRVAGAWPHFGHLYIDGRWAYWSYAFDTEQPFPRREITRIQVTIDGKHLHVPRNLWRDLYDPSLRPWGLFAWLTRDDKALRVKLVADANSFTYAVMLTVPSSGPATRRELRNGPQAELEVERSELRARPRSEWAREMHETLPEREVGFKRGAVAGHTFWVRIETRRFDSRYRSLWMTPIQRGAGPWLHIAGRTAQGAIDWIPLYEIASFRVKIDGRDLPVPPRLWNDLYDPEPEHGGLLAWLKKDGKTLRVKLEGSDGEGGYYVLFTLRSNGRHTRRIDYGD